METINQLSDLTLFGLIFFAIAIGWTIGYIKGVVNGYNHAQEEGIQEYPVRNVYFFETDKEEQYSFVDMVTGANILVGSFDECIEYVKARDSSKKIVFSKGDSDEQ